jgi:hypothetical protein
MPATTAVYPELAEEPALSPSKGLPHTWRVQYHRPCGAVVPKPQAAPGLKS